MSTRPSTHDLLKMTDEDIARLEPRLFCAGGPQPPKQPPAPAPQPR